MNHLNDKMNGRMEHQLWVQVSSEVGFLLRAQLYAQLRKHMRHQLWIRLDSRLQELIKYK